MCVLHRMLCVLGREPSRPQTRTRLRAAGRQPAASASNAQQAGPVVMHVTARARAFPKRTGKSALGLCIAEQVPMAGRGLWQQPHPPTHQQQQQLWQKSATKRRRRLYNTQFRRKQGTQSNDKQQATLAGGG